MKSNANTKRRRPVTHWPKSLNGCLTTRLKCWIFGLAVLSALPISAWAGPPTFKLLPQNANIHCGVAKPCTQPTVDGIVAPVEYADGMSFPLQDYVNGGPNGELFVLVSDAPVYAPNACNFGPPSSPDLPPVRTNPCLSQVIFLGLKVPRPKDSHGNFVPATGQVAVWLDANRADTLNGVFGANFPRPEDRKVLVSYGNLPGGSTSIVQYIGNGQGWSPLGNVFAGWSMSQSASVPVNDPGHVHIEIAITLHSLLTSSSEPLTSHLLGLGVAHFPMSLSGFGQIKAAGGTLPNSGTMPPQDAIPFTWATLDFSNPPPIPMSFTMWNVGQMPTPLANGGSANAGNIEDVVLNKENVCLAEVWTSGERLDIVAKVNHRRQLMKLPPMNAVYEANDEVLRTPTNSTGLVLLTTHEVLLSGIHHFPASECTGWDCLQHKGVLWARLALPTAHNVPPKLNSQGPPTPALGIDASEFMDVFCAHVNSGDAGPGTDTVIRRAQFQDIEFFMRKARSGGPLTMPPNPPDDQLPLGTWPSGLDRPAVLLGDLNTPGAHGVSNGSFVMSKNWGDSQDYRDLLSDLRLDMPTQFDKSNNIFSDARDLNMTVAGPNPSASGTSLSDLCNGGFTSNKLVDAIRYDYILVVPPADTDELPAFALSAAPAPAASVDAHFLGNPTFTCLSDHTQVDVSLGLVRVKDKLKYNAMKPHHAEFDVTHLIDLASGGCCADWYTNQVVLTSPTLGTQVNVALDHSAFEGQEVSPNWNVQSGPGSAISDAPAAFTGRVSATFSLWEWDSGSPDDHYDSIPQGGNGTTNDDLDVHLSFFAGTGEIDQVAGAGANWTIPVGFIGNVNAGVTDFALQTIGNNQDTGDNAVVEVHFRISELDAP